MLPAPGLGKQNLVKLPGGPGAVWWFAILRIRFSLGRCRVAACGDLSGHYGQGRRERRPRNTETISGENKRHPFAVAACWRPGVCPRTCVRGRRSARRAGVRPRFRTTHRPSALTKGVYTKDKGPGSLRSPGQNRGWVLATHSFPFAQHWAPRFRGPCASRRYSTRHALLSVS